MEKWMSRIPDNRAIVLINLPGSHDSTAYNMFCLGSCFAKTQDLDITSQLNIGVRLFDIRVTKRSNLFESDLINDIICCHGICDCYHTEKNRKVNLTYEHVLEEIKLFLQKNPSETVIIKTKSGRGNKSLNLQFASEIFDNILGDISVEYNDKCTLGQLRGKVVNVFDKYNSIEGTDIISIHEKYTNGNSNFNEFKVNGDLKVREIMELMEKYYYKIDEAENYMKLPLNYETSCTGEFTKIIPLPRYEANIVNKFLREYEFRRGYYYGWISADFIDELITKKIIESNFGEDDNNINDLSEDSL
jgi:1-phosphatidylinositol phosphodiesterase